MKVHFDNLPPPLKERELFCKWKYESRPNAKPGDKPAKVPYDPRTGSRASSADPSTFGDFRSVQDYEATGHDGVGVGIFGNVAAIDIDHCITADGKLSDMAQDIINRMASYTERSPSNEGIRILFKVPVGYKYDTALYYVNNQKIGLEVYVHGVTNKYVSVTGQTLTTGAELEERGEELNGVLEAYMVRPTPQPSVPAQTAPPPQVGGQQGLTMQDQIVIMTLQNGPSGPRFKRLMAGDLSESGGDHSSADLSLCNMLASQGSDAEQMDRVFRTSGLMRTKWDEPRGAATYGAMTIAKALASYPNRSQQSAASAPTVPQQFATQPAPTVPAAQTPVVQAPAVQAATAPVAKVVQDPIQFPQSALAEQPFDNTPQLFAPVVLYTNAPQEATPQSPEPLQQMTSQQKLYLDVQRVTISAQELMAMKFPPVVYHVEGMIPAGLTLLVAAPKQGKSWFCLWLCRCLADGIPFMGRSTTKTEVLYLALEDTPQRLQKRLEKLLCGAPVPAGFHFITTFPTMEKDFFEALDCFLAQHPNTGLVIVDTLAKVRGPARRGESAYSYDYRELAQLKKFADSRGISLILVHHLRKMKDDSDGFNQVSGTTGLTGAVDTTMVISKDKRTNEQAILSITGRDVEETTYPVVFDKSTCRWEFFQDYQLTHQQDLRLQYETNPTVQTLRLLISQNPDGKWEGIAKDLLKAGEAQGYVLANCSKDLNDKLALLENDLLQYDGIHRTPISTNGNGGKRYRYFRLPPTAAGDSSDSADTDSEDRPLGNDGEGPDETLENDGNGTPASP